MLVFEMHIVTLSKFGKQWADFLLPIAELLGTFTSVGTWLSLVEHSVRDAGVGGSNPLVPTISIHKKPLFSGFLFSKILNLEFWV